MSNNEPSFDSAEPLLFRVYDLIGAGMIAFDSSAAQQFMPYRGTVDEVIFKLKHALLHPSAESDMDLFLYPNRLLNGIIDYALREKTDVLRLKHQAEKFGVEVFKGNYAAASGILSMMDFGDAAGAPVDEGTRKGSGNEPDFISWAAFEPSIIEDLMIEMERDEVEFDYIFSNPRS